MEILYDEMHFEVLRHLELSQLLKIRTLSKQHNTYVLNKHFWNIYLKYKTQAEYRRLTYKVGKHGSVELFKLLSSNYHNKVMEKCMYERIYYDASIHDNTSIREYVEHFIARKSRGKFDFNKLMETAGRNFSQENTNKICGYFEKENPAHNLWVLKVVLLNCHTYEILLKYLNEFKLEAHAFIDIDFIEDVVTGESKYSYELFIGIIEEGIININDLRNEIFIHECSDKRIFEYLLYEGLVTFDYETFKASREDRPNFPFCEYYIIKLYEEVLNLYKNKKREDEYKFLWRLVVYSSHIIEDQDVTLNMVKQLCNLKYSGARLLELIFNTDAEGQDYLTINLKSMKLQYDCN